jgi:nucleoside-diphosphate-sugar epimerase
LVTGSAGFIGRHLTAELAGRGHTVLPYDMPRSVLDRASLREAMQQADAAINLAGVLGTAETLGAERRAAEVNVLGAVNVLDLAAAGGVPVVQIATGHEGQPNPYAATKRCATDLALARARWTGQPVTVVRAYHVYGPGQTPPPPHGPSTVRKVVPSMVCRALSGMPVEVFGSGRQEIDLVWAGDVARVLADAIGGPYGEVVEAGTGKPTTVLDAARDVLAQVLGGALLRGVAPPLPSVAHLPMRAGEPADATVVAAAPACLNPWPHRLGETIDWYRDYLAGQR